MEGDSEIVFLYVISHWDFNTVTQQQVKYLLRPTEYARVIQNTSFNNLFTAFSLPVFTFRANVARDI